MALKSTALDDINYQILRAAILGDTLNRIARKARLSESTARKHVKFLENNGHIGINVHRSRRYYFTTEKGEQSMIVYEGSLGMSRSFERSSRNQNGISI